MNCPKVSSGDKRRIRTIAIYIKGFRREGRKFLEAAREVSREKSIVVYKAGRGIESVKAVKSNTAAIAGGYAFYEALFKQTGLIETDDLYELFDMAQALALSPSRGDKVLVIVGET